MQPTARPSVDRVVTAALVAWAGVAFGPMGCGVRPSDRLVIATSWPLDDCRRLESEFAGWVAASSGPVATGSVRVDWLILGPGDDPARVAGRRTPPDVLLGGPASSFERPVRLGRLSPRPPE